MDVQQDGRNRQDGHHDDKAPLKLQMVDGMQGDDTVDAQADDAGGNQGIGDDVDALLFGFPNDEKQDQQNEENEENDGDAYLDTVVQVLVVEVEQEQQKGRAQETSEKQQEHALLQEDDERDVDEQDHAYGERVFGPCQVLGHEQVDDHGDHGTGYQDESRQLPDELLLLPFAEFLEIERPGFAVG